MELRASGGVYTWGRGCCGMRSWECVRMGLVSAFLGAQHVTAGFLLPGTPWEGCKGAALIRPLWPRGRRMQAGFWGAVSVTGGCLENGGAVRREGVGGAEVSCARQGKGGPPSGYSDVVRALPWLGGEGCRCRAVPVT